jgi:hypothetical protein
MEPASELRGPNWHRACGIRVTRVCDCNGHDDTEWNRVRGRTREANGLFRQLHKGTRAAIDVSRGGRGSHDRQKKN